MLLNTKKGSGGMNQYRKKVGEGKNYIWLVVLACLPNYASRLLSCQHRPVPSHTLDVISTKCNSNLTQQSTEIKRYKNAATNQDETPTELIAWLNGRLKNRSRDKCTYKIRPSTGASQRGAVEEQPTKQRRCRWFCIVWRIYWLVAYKPSTWEHDMLKT